MRRIVIVGGGYAGFYAAWMLEKRLRRGEAQLTLIDPLPYMTYQPFLPEVVGGSIEARHVGVSLRRHLHRSKVITGAATDIDHAHKVVSVRLALGGEITVRSTLGEGSVFTLALPASVIHAGQGKSDDSSSTPGLAAAS